MSPSSLTEISCQIQSSGEYECGDSVNWAGHYYYLTGIDPVYFADYVFFYEAGFGGCVRHPGLSFTKNSFGAFYKNPWVGCISRDQLTGRIAGLIASGDRVALLRLIFNHALKLFLFSNNVIKNGETTGYKMPDLTGPEIWQMELRGVLRHWTWWTWVFYFVLLILDLWLLLQCLWDRYISKDNDNISFLLQTFVALDHCRTLIGELMIIVLDYEQLEQKVSDYHSGWRKREFMIEHYTNKLRGYENEKR